MKSAADVHRHTTCCRHSTCCLNHGPSSTQHRRGRSRSLLTNRQSIIPLRSEEAFRDWVNLAGGVVGTAARASALRLASAVGRSVATQRMMRIDTVLRTTSTSIDGFATIAAGAATLQNGNDLSAEERALALGGSLFVAATLPGGGGRPSGPAPRQGELRECGEDIRLQRQCGRLFGGQPVDQSLCRDRRREVPAGVAGARPCLPS